MQMLAGPLDTLFMYPYAEDKDLIWKCREQNLWNSQAYAPIAKERLEELRLIAKEAQRFKKKLQQVDQQSEIYLAPARYQPDPRLFIITDKTAAELEDTLQSIMRGLSSQLIPEVMERKEWADFIEMFIKDGILI